MKPRMTLPKAADSTLITTRLANAPAKTVVRECREAIIAAMRKVLSPIYVSAASACTPLPLNERVNYRYVEE